MDLLLLIFLPAAALIFISLRLARLVVRSRFSLLSMFLCNFASFVLMWGLILSFNRDNAFSSILGYGIGSILAAFALLLFKRKKHAPEKITIADVDVRPYSSELAQNQLQDLQNKVSVRRQLYNQWFRNYLFQIIILTGAFCMFNALS